MSIAAQVPVETIRWLPTPSPTQVMLTAPSKMGRHIITVGHCPWIFLGEESDIPRGRRLSGFNATSVNYCEQSHILNGQNGFQTGWPADHTGWRFAGGRRTISLSGISLNMNDRMTVAGSQGTNQISLPMRMRPNPRNFIASSIHKSLSVRYEVFSVPFGRSLHVFAAAFAGRACHRRFRR